MAALGSVGSHAIAPGSDWTTLQEQEDGSNSSIGSLTYQLSTPNNYTPDWTIADGPEWVAVGVALKEASGCADVSRSSESGANARDCPDAKVAP
jgi:hypothetical protein